MGRSIRIEGLSAPLEICWDNLGLPHVYAKSREDAFAGMGYAAGYQRLWQAHLSALWARGEVSAVLGKRFLTQDALLRAFNVPADNLGMPDSPGDPIVEAYLAGINAYIDSLDEVPPEFLHAGVEPRHFTSSDIASRFRFTGWHQHRTWVEKIFLGRMIAEQGLAYWQPLLRRITPQDAALAAEMQDDYRHLNPNMARLMYPGIAVSGSNNWAVRGQHSASGLPLLATDPHQPHSIPNTFFFVHLSAPGWDVFGASFAGMPYFMMGYTRDLAWGLTTGFIDNDDVYLEKLKGEDYLTPQGWKPLEQRALDIQIRDEPDAHLNLSRTRHGPVLETLVSALNVYEGTHAAVRDDTSEEPATAVAWALENIPTSAGTLTRLPLAKNAAEFGDYLFENDVTPLVNNILCVDRENDLRRWIVATLPKRSEVGESKGISGSLPLPGWKSDYDFPMTRAEDLLVEHNPQRGFSATANDDTMEERGEFPIHNFPAPNARRDRIVEVLEAGIREGRKFSVDDFKALQLDYTDVYARDTLPDLLACIDNYLSGCPGPPSHNQVAQLKQAQDLLSRWDFSSDPNSVGASVYYTLQDSQWHLDFMQRALQADALDAHLIPALPLACRGLNRFRVADFLQPGSAWAKHRDLLCQVIAEHTWVVIEALQRELGDAENWQWGKLHQIQFWHSLKSHGPWQDMRVGPDPIGGSATSLRMALRMGKGPGEPRGENQSPFRVYHGPAYRLVVDLADPGHGALVIAGGNSGRPGDPHVKDHYAAWLAGDYFTVCFERNELTLEEVWQSS